MFFFIFLSCYIPIVVFFYFSLYFFLSIGWYCGAGVFDLIGCISLSLSLALPTSFNDDNNNNDNNNNNNHHFIKERVNTEKFIVSRVNLQADFLFCQMYTQILLSYGQLMLNVALRTLSGESRKKECVFGITTSWEFQPLVCIILWSADVVRVTYQGSYEWSIKLKTPNVDHVSHVWANLRVQHRTNISKIKLFFS